MRCICIFWACQKQQERSCQESTIFFKYNQEKPSSCISLETGFQKHNHQQISSKRKKISKLIVDETVMKVGSELIWL